MLLLCAPDPGQAKSELPPPLGTASQWSSYGEGVRDRPRSLRKVLNRGHRHVGQRLVVEATVEDVCAKKGCWMMLVDGDHHVRVTFKDYGFFVPRDIHGAEVRVEGTLVETEVSVELLKHYLEDAGRHEEAARVTEPERGYAFEATGVTLRRPR